MILIVPKDCGCDVPVRKLQPIDNNIADMITMNG
jgi:hypothetical protein